jgi:glycosyltransferase involved in cell wall biosynthesis
MSEHHPNVSVVIPTYNREDVISRAIDSVLKQTYTNFEIIIVDDGSTDNTEEVINELQKQHEEIKYFSQDNAGAAVARNHGIRKADGNYIAFLDSDDQWLPEKLETQLELFRESDQVNIGFVGANKIICKCDSDDQVVSKKDFYKNRFSKEEQPFTLEDFLSLKNPVSPSTALISTKALEDVGLFDPECPPHEDYELWIRLREQYNFETTWTPLAKYRDWEEGISKTTTSGKKASVKTYIMNKHSKLYRRYPKARSVILRKIGTEHMLTGNHGKAIAHFYKSIKCKPLHFRNYLNLVVALFGRSTYQFLLRMQKT